MARGDNLKGKKTGNNFAINPQPAPERKSVPKKITKLKKALEYFSETHKQTVNGVELTLESNIGYVLLEKANKGDLQAIKLLSDILGWNASTKNETEIIVKNRAKMKLPNGMEFDI